MRMLVEQLSHVEPGTAVADLVLQKLKQLEGQRDQLVAERADVLRRAERWRALGDQLEGIETWCRRMAAKLEHMSYAEKRDALFMIGVRVRSWPKGHPDTPDDADRYIVEASIPLDGPDWADIVGCTSRPAAGRPSRAGSRWRPSGTAAPGSEASGGRSGRLPAAGPPRGSGAPRAGSVPSARP
jgi:hypothetical protein